MRGITNSITELSVKTGTSDKLTNVTIYMELLEKRGGVVSWNGELSSTVDIASWQTLATLPQGFRPNSNFMTSLVDFGGNNLPLTVTTEGQIKTSHVLKNKNDGHYYYLSMVFMAGGGIKALLGKARALLQEVLSHAGKYQCDKQGTAIHRLAYFERKMDTQRGRRAGNDRWIIGHRQWGGIDHGMHRAPHEITGRECKLPNIRPIRLGHMPRLCYGGRDPEIQLDGHNDRIWDGNVQYRMTKGLVA